MNTCKKILHFDNLEEELLPRRLNKLNTTENKFTTFQNQITKVGFLTKAEEERKHCRRGLTLLQRLYPRTNNNQWAPFESSITNQTSTTIYPLLKGVRSKFLLQKLNSK